VIGAAQNPSVSSWPPAGDALGGQSLLTVFVSLILPRFRRMSLDVSTISLDDCEQIFAQALASKSESEFCRAIEPLFDVYEVLSLEFGRGNIFWRARIIKNDIYSNLSELDYPPPELARRGRLNDTGTPCFYISARKETALAEVDAAEGQLVQVAGFRFLNEAPARLVVIGEYSNVHKNGYMHFAGRDPDMTIAKILNAMPGKEALTHIYIDKFFAAVLADPDASSNGYMFSRALAQAIYARNSADAIVFPSVKDRGGFNIGVKAEQSDKSFHNVCCIVVRMGKARQFGVIEFDLLRSAEHLDGEWNFIWLADAPDVIGIYNMTKEEYDVVSRAPDDPNNLLYLAQLHRTRT
jgi:hypothetical protein